MKSLPWKRLLQTRELVARRLPVLLASLCLCAAGGLERVPHESGSGTAGLSGDKVIRTGNNERERKS